MNAPTLILVLMYLGFWAWMIVECAACEKNRIAKIAWLGFLVPCGPVVGVWYYLVRILPRVIDELSEERKAAA